MDKNNRGDSMRGDYTKRKLKKLNKNIFDFFNSFFYEIKRFFIKKNVKNNNFTIISNNCWAGKCYQYLDMPYLTPTVGLYFFAPDYIKFISNLKYYLEIPLEFIDATESKYYDELCLRNQIKNIIARLDNVEIVFLHYKTKEEAIEKWERRKKRVNYDNIIIKFSRMNLCTEPEFEAFSKIPFTSKFFIDNRLPLKFSWQEYVESCDENGFVKNDTQPFPQKINLKNILNKRAEKYPEDGFDISDYLKIIGE